MTMVSISPLTYDIDGGVVLHRVDVASALRGVARRVTRVPTLDGGADVNDTGYAPADTTIDVVQQDPAAADYARLEVIVQTYAEVLVCAAGKAWRAVPESVAIQNGALRLRLLVTAEA